MLSSKELCKRTGISRATLNNYITLGILPKPDVQPAGDDDGSARRLGYFPDHAIDIVDTVRRLKKEGNSMEDIGRMFEDGEISVDRRGNGAATGSSNSAAIASGMTERRDAAQTARMQLTLDGIDSPAYLVNYRFQVEWFNERAARLLLDHGTLSQSEINARNVFRALIESLTARGATDIEPLIALHLKVARQRLSKSALLTLDDQMSDDALDMLARLYDGAEPLTSRGPISIDVDLAPAGQPPELYRVHVSFFREGIFFAYGALEAGDETLETFLSRRDVVIRELLKNRKPYLTPLAVLVADLQDSVRICAELPPEEYFELINQIWVEMEPVLRRYSGTRGKHAGDGLVCYFFPQPDSNCILNAVQCAREMAVITQRVDAEWRSKKNWGNRLLLNFGLDEGQEWFGTYQTPTYIEFSVLGDTVNRAARLSDFARDGRIWATKNMISALSSKERSRVFFGVRSPEEKRNAAIVPNSFVRVNDLIDLDNPRYHKFVDIAALPVTEIIDCADDED